MSFFFFCKLDESVPNPAAAETFTTVVGSVRARPQCSAASGVPSGGRVVPHIGSQDRVGPAGSGRSFANGGLPSMCRWSASGSTDSTPALDWLIMAAGRIVESINLYEGRMPARDAARTGWLALRQVLRAWHIEEPNHLTGWLRTQGFQGPLQATTFPPEVKSSFSERPSAPTHEWHYWKGFMCNWRSTWVVCWRCPSHTPRRYFLRLWVPVPLQGLIGACWTISRSMRYSSFASQC